MQCSTYRTDSTSSQCTEKATMWLLHPDGARNPGGYVCDFHGYSVIREYQEKLGEEWGSEPIQTEKI